MKTPRSASNRRGAASLVFASAVFVSLSAHGGPRSTGDVTPQEVEKVKLLGISRIDELPPLPPGAKANTLVQPLGVAVPIFEVISDQMADRGATANTGAATAIVYRNSHDTGFAQYNKADAGNFTGNLLHLGNVFPLDGGEIHGYDLLVYNDHNSPGGDAACTVSLWDGDPLGLIDTRISDPPQPIPGTTCTFSRLAKGYIPPPWGCTIDSDGDGKPDTCYGDPAPGGPCVTDWDCGICGGPVQGDDIPECPGLYRLVCDFDPKVTLPSRNVWMIVEWTEGCRMGWRWALYQGPEIAAVGEESFCDDSCSSAPVPCVDMAIELVDAASQWSSIGVGTCCEDPGIACDHSDGTNECGHPTSCSDGVADDFDAWCFGAPTYFASFVASIYANTDTTISLVPVGSSGTHTIDIDNNEIIMPNGGQSIELEMFAAGWETSDGDPNNQNPRLRTWVAEIDSSSYLSGLAGYLTNSRPPCTQDGDCPNHTDGELCSTYGYCGGAWQECPGRDDLCFDLPACDVSGPNPRCGSTQLFGIPLIDDGTPNYGMSLRLKSSVDAKGTFEVGFLPDPKTFLKDQHNTGVALIAFVPAKVTIQVGKCCDRSGGLGNELCLDNLTVGECDAVGGLFFPGEMCDPDVDDSIECGPFCGDGEVNQSSEECDGVDDAGCLGPCGTDCLCVHFCGDDEVNQSWEQCDGMDDGLCPGKCRPDCTCAAICGDGVANHESEECDGADAIRCPGQCREDCSCPPGAIPAVSEWGLVALTLLLLSGARIYYGRRPACKRQLIL